MITAEEALRITQNYKQGKIKEYLDSIEKNINAAAYSGRTQTSFCIDDEFLLGHLKIAMDSFGYKAQIKTEPRSDPRNEQYLTKVLYIDWKGSEAT